MENFRENSATRTSFFLVQLGSKKTTSGTFFEKLLRNLSLVLGTLLVSAIPRQLMRRVIGRPDFLSKDLLYHLRGQFFPTVIAPSPNAI